MAGGKSVMATLIILRGNSGSGKTSTARLLQRELGYGTMVVSQDVVRREMLYVEDTVKQNPTPQLLHDLCMYGNKLGGMVILEGVLGREKYGGVLYKLLRNFQGNIHVYYFDISLEETVRRHGQRAESQEFGIEKMRAWRREKDYLGTPGEVLINETMSQDDIVQMIISDVTGKAQKNKGA
ncbi:MAG: AAA family ATPase [Candidatus Saccharibacteria bacterium]|nr:AAA family ATPase [Candidatus Saccharibacteria bacterium]